MFAHSFRRTPILLNLLAILVLTTSGTISAQPASGIDVAQAATRVSDAPFRSSPVMFIENTGQWDERTRFQVRGAPAGTMWLAEDAMWITVVERPAEDGARSRLDRLGRLNPERANVQPANVQREAVNIKLSFVGANPHPRLEQFDRLDTVVSYFLGNESEKWRPDVPVWGGVRYVNLYPGVDLEITSEDGRIVQRLAARPDADLNAVRLQVEGADAVALDGDTLRLSTSAGEAILPLLLAAGSSGEAEVQPRGAQAFDVASPFMPTGVNPQFAIANPQSPADNLADLLYGTYLGGSSPEQSNHHGIAVDGAGSAYVTSWTDSPDFPSTPGAFDPSENGGADAFVVKLNPAGGGLAYATFLGGSWSDGGASIAVDGAGNAYVTGSTGSSNFPTTTDASDRSYNGSYSDAFVVKLNPTGSRLAYATYLGGNDNDSGYGIAMDDAGNAYVTGDTQSANFPTTTGAFDTSLNGYYDAFVVRLNPTGSGLAYATFLGGASGDYGTAIAVDGAGSSAYVAGWTQSSDFPTTPGAFDTSYNGGDDAFVAKLNWV